MSYMSFASQSFLFPGGQKLKQDAFVQMMEQPFPKKRLLWRCLSSAPQMLVSSRSGCHLHPPPNSLRQIDSDHPWSEARLSSLKVAD